MKIFTVADVPDELARAWMQHLRDFDNAHPGCHFVALGDAPNMKLEEIIDALRIRPALPIQKVFRRKRKPPPGPDDYGDGGA